MRGATSISRPACELAVNLASLARLTAGFIVAVCLIGAARATAGDEAPRPASREGEKAALAQFARHAEAAFIAARERAAAHADDLEAAWQFGRACFDWADFPAAKARRAEIANLGIAACRRVVSADTNSAPGHYYLAMNLAQLAQTKRLGALEIVTQMEREFTRAKGLDPALDYAGAERNLGLLYLEAPGWPVSIGSHAKAREHLRAAVERAPEYPENHLNLITAYVKWGDRAAARKELEVLDHLWAQARATLTGDAWGSAWLDWEDRRRKLTEEAKETPATTGHRLGRP